MFEQVLAFTKKQYEWSDKYAEAVLEEYQRFMFIKALDSNTLATDPINKFWNVHILYTENYFDYCQKNFGKFIHHIPDIELDQNRKQKLISKTIKIYTSLYPSITYPNIWNINTELINFDKCSDQFKKIKIKIVYTSDIQNAEYNSKVLSINITPNMIFTDLINFVAKKTYHSSDKIKIYPSNSYFIAMSKTKTNDSNSEIIRSKFNYYLVELF